MREKSLIGRLLLLTLGAAVGVDAVACLQPALSHSAAERSAATDQGAALELVRADVDHLQAVAPSQSHSMTDVGYHFASLWYAGQRQNWDLAAFYLGEARSSLRWTIRIRPVRKDPDGNDIDLQGIFDGIDGSVFGRVQEAIEARDGTKFTAAYRTSLEACYACHRAAGKPYLRPMVPVTSPQPIINFDPRANWP